MHIIFATLAGGGIVHWLLALLIVGLCLLAIWAVGRWCLLKFAAPAIVITVWDVLFVLVGLIVIVNALMGMIGHPFIPY
jgi:hypothetical protein